jgi:hypothetical protein
MMAWQPATISARRFSQSFFDVTGETSPVLL